MTRWSQWRVYYARFIPQVRDAVFRRGIPQVIALLTALMIILFQSIYGLVPDELTWTAVKSLLWPYALVLAGIILWAWCEAPVQLDVDSQAEQTKELAAMGQQLEERDMRISDLQRTLPIPYAEQQMREEVKNALDPLPSGALERIRKMWLGGTLRADALNSAGAPEGAELLAQLCQQGQIIHRIEQDRHQPICYRVNDKYHGAVGWYFSQVERGR